MEKADHVWHIKLMGSWKDTGPDFSKELSIRMCVLSEVKNIASIMVIKSILC